MDPSQQLSRGYYYLLVADDFEAQLLTSQSDTYAAIRELHHRGAQNVIIKHKDEALIFSDQNSYHVQAIRPVRFMQEAGVGRKTACLTHRSCLFTGQPLAPRTARRTSRRPRRLVFRFSCSNPASRVRSIGVLNVTSPVGHSGYALWQRIPDVTQGSNCSSATEALQESNVMYKHLISGYLHNAECALLRRWLWVRAPPNPLLLKWRESISSGLLRSPVKTGPAAEPGHLERLGPQSNRI